MSDVFISYARKIAVLPTAWSMRCKLPGANSWIDWEDIPRMAEWWQGIQDGRLSYGAGGAEGTQPAG